MKWLNLSKRSNELNIGRSFTWPEMTPQDWLMEFISLTGLVAMFAFTMYHYSKLPATIPVHFDYYGNPKEYGSRNQVWIIPGISLLLHFALPIGEKFLQFRGTPGFLRRVHTQSQFNMRVRLIRYTKMIVILGLFYISVSTIRLALHSGNGIGIWFAPVFLALILIPTLYYHLFSK
ncbi:MAG: DUF1648 domain-containing protein [Bacteroidetes bacterium]|nr:DUF1648 domain-containing protein [Bacteroidota bacterium]